MKIYAASWGGSHDHDDSVCIEGLNLEVIGRRLTLSDGTSFRFQSRPYPNHDLFSVTVFEVGTDYLRVDQDGDEENGDVLVMASSPSGITIDLTHSQPRAGKNKGALI